MSATFALPKALSRSSTATSSQEATPAYAVFSKKAQKERQGDKRRAAVRAFAANAGSQTPYTLALTPKGGVVPSSPRSKADRTKSQSAKKKAQWLGAARDEKGSK